MKAFICVYRHINPKKEKKQVEKAAINDPLLKQFLINYDNNTNFFDWGDDPAFFAAEEILKDAKFATWGVCRRDVRSQLEKDDLVIFFCGRQEKNIWDYYFIGFGTVKQSLRNRQLIWEDDTYKDYRKFYNLLVDDNGKWCEPFGCEHKDWEKRKDAPYIFFEIKHGSTDFNLVNPIKIATYIPSVSSIEIWHSQEDVVKQLEVCLFEKHFKHGRKLRTTNKQIAHRHISLHNVDENKMNELRTELMEISVKARAYSFNHE